MLDGETAAGRTAGLASALNGLLLVAPWSRSATWGTDARRQLVEAECLRGGQESRLILSLAVRTFPLAKLIWTILLASAQPSRAAPKSRTETL